MNHQTYMTRCLELALKGAGNVSPNPLVGCVIVAGDAIIGEGYHHAFGQAHAEVNAVRSVLEKFGEEQGNQLLREATVYVNLEPCAHFGKTPPCADLLVRHGVKAVLIGNRDPFEAVNGKGIEKLQQAGIQVQWGIEEGACTWLNRRFFTRIRRQRPYIILKWAQTANGLFAPRDGAQRWITGREAKRLVHQWRAEEDAVLVGKGTALADRPLLTVRETAGRNPVRILVDRQLGVPATNPIMNTEARTLILNENKTDVEANLHYIAMEDMQFYLPQKIAYQLYLMDIQSVIIEGGIQILNLFIEAGLWDEARVFTGPQSWEAGLEAPHLQGRLLEQLEVGADELNIYKNPSL
ncbi:bifunctional diaminohydroxyphosphoribosylaminopyrimidine deaminase/5-amino-6-(5-phosphoribosylamino)uracil reductase RibD [Pedobacter yulinensis]|uniref:Riboflavin biosynthesis protein RibD n=1 Tax=Pedobacter yulinensis TaxID=2126353 RepID=A0A2T3HKY4_9SPHI|nr:bifunctional diaminohydroxyphosphoribosylaminopyrimidine deaminase/5-amino-6-(5-phosphoribosylamino)uracil reductase RibD [Pedobacter yulinensis]PST83041.1 bifunctional diaminohydroxyphosphoribosylaminopyrimidine deaminase/5-amino-6-(5-phosphoribosylamino)uracil reductase RibD [Pedobacter yulinensis]